MDPTPAVSGYKPMIDMHSHFHGAGFDDVLRKRESTPRIITETNGEEYLVKAPGNKFRFTNSHTDISKRLEFMDSIGLQIQMITFAGNLGVDVLPIKESIPVVTEFNTNLSAVRQQYSERFVTLAGLPLADIKAAGKELRRSRLELGHMGAIVPAGYFSDLSYLERLRPLFETADDVGSHFMVHPGPRDDQLGLTDISTDNFSMQRISVLNLQNDISHAVITLTMSDFLNDYPNVTVQVINLGGTIPFVLERLQQVLKLRTPDKTVSLTERLRKIYVDNGSLGPRALEVAVSAFGADRIMLGTDYPYFPTGDSCDAINDAAIDDAQKMQILNGNAISIIDRYM